MKKLFAVTVIAAVAALVLAGCDLFDEKKDGEQKNNTTLKIQNESFSEITEVIWSSASFGSITKGSHVTKEVQEGNGYIYFKRKTSPINARTDQLVTIEKNEQKVFVITDNTLIVDVDNSNNKGTFGSLQPVITTLKIQNESFSDITDVIWSSASFGSITKGSFLSKDIQEGNGYIYFKRSSSPINARTDQLIAVDKNEQKAFVFNDNTPIVDADNPSNKGTFSALGTQSQITVKAGNTPIEQFGDYDFGSSLLEVNKDITFTIGNSGKADLKFNVVGGNVINLSNNTSGYFSVTQQPFASMTIPSGNTTTFVIRFNPKAVGNNFNAEVTIVTNSGNDSEFTFRVKGNGSNEYAVGDTGPGGGTVFFAQGGQYKECSGELGSYNWDDAKTTAQNYKGGGLTDWYLPDQAELQLMYENLHRKTLGGFVNTYYWSSTPGGYGHMYLSFNNGVLSGFDGETFRIYRVRAVRSFTL
ncbi:MAG: hypothetical protein LBH43_03260 [Treponema sp.]|jgi:hypothetical protein|nr:hypothetical protein [Treponema sp.]